MPTNQYNTCLLLSQQFRHCGNPLRADTYQGCSFGCKYCFVSNRNYYGKKSNKAANIDIFKKYILGKHKGIEQELINHRVPIHLGGMSDPFQKREWDENKTYEFLNIFQRYPVSISTKTAYIPEKYFDVLNPKYHIFQISLISPNDKIIRIYENKTPPATDRIEFVKELKKRGFWVSIRIQPMIYIDDAIELLHILDGYIDYAIVEHLKVSYNGDRASAQELLSLVPDGHLYRPWRNYYKLPIQIIKNNIDKIKSSTKIKIGCGDNEIHSLSDSLNCCGLDCAPDSFANWLKYNSMQILMTDNKCVYIPIGDITLSNIPNNIYNKCHKQKSYKYYVDDYMKDVFNYGENTLF